MGVAENKKLIRTMFAELSKGNAEGFLAALADDVRFTITGTTRFSGTMNGKKEVVDKLLVPLGAALAGGIAITIDNLVAEGDYVVMESRGQARAKSGKPYNNHYCHVFRAVSGKVQEVTEYFDTALAISALG